jgi:high mobility group protein B1
LHIIPAMAPEQPKKALTAFFLYCNEQRPTITKQLGDQASVKGMVIKTAAEQWKGLSADVKAPYEKKAADGKAAYDSALEKFKASGGEVVRKSKKDKDSKAKKDKDAPKKPSGGGYGQYLSQHRAEIVKSLPAGSNPISDVAKVAGGRWKALSEAEKKPYEEKFVEKMKDFRAAMEAYTASKPAAEEEEEDEEEAEEEEEKEEKAATPKAKAGKAKAEKSEAPPAKRAKKEEKPAVQKAKAGKAKGPVVPEIDAKILAEAQKLGWESQLRNLVNREDVQALGKKDKDLLAALSSSNGLVNPARRALLGA